MPQEPFVYPGQTRTTPTPGLLGRTRPTQSTQQTTPFGRRKYDVKDSETGKEYEIEWEGPNDPTEDEIKEMLSIDDKGPYYGERAGKSHGWLADQLWNAGKKVIDTGKGLLESTSLGETARMGDELARVREEDAKAKAAGASAVSSLEAKRKAESDEYFGKVNKALRNPFAIGEMAGNALDPTGVFMGTTSAVHDSYESFKRGDVGGGVVSGGLAVLPAFGLRHEIKKAGIPKNLLPPDNPVVPPVTPVGGNPAKANALPPIEKLPGAPEPNIRKQGQHSIGVKVEDVPTYTEQGYTIIDTFPDGSVLMEPPPRSRFGPTPGFGRATVEELGRPLTPFEEHMRKKKDEEGGLPPVEPPTEPPTPPTPPVAPVTPLTQTGPFGAGRPAPPVEPVEPPTTTTPVAGGPTINYGRTDNIYSIRNQGSQFFVEHPSLQKPAGPFRSYNQADKWINDQVNPFEQFPVEPPTPKQEPVPPVTPVESPVGQPVPPVEPVNPLLDRIRELDEAGAPDYKYKELLSPKQQKWGGKVSWRQQAIDEASVTTSATKAIGKAEATTRSKVAILKAKAEAAKAKLKALNAKLNPPGSDKGSVSAELLTAGLIDDATVERFHNWAKGLGASLSDANLLHYLKVVEKRDDISKALQGNALLPPESKADRIPVVKDEPFRPGPKARDYIEQQRNNSYGSNQHDVQRSPFEQRNYEDFLRSLDWKVEPIKGQRISPREMGDAARDVTLKDVDVMGHTGESLVPRTEKAVRSHVIPTEEQVRKLLRDNEAIADRDLLSADVAANRYLAGEGGDPMVYREMAIDSLRKVKEAGFKDFSKHELAVYDQVVEKLDNGSKTINDLRRSGPDVEVPRSGFGRLLDVFKAKEEPIKRDKFGLPALEVPDNVPKESFKEFVARTMDGMTPERFNRLPGDIRNGAAELYRESQAKVNKEPGTVTDINKLKPKFQARRSKYGVFTSDPAEMIRRMKDSFKEVDNIDEAHFITPDGKMYNHLRPLDSHGSSMREIGIDIYEALEKANIIRVGAPNAIEVGMPISKTQAKLIHDMMMSNKDPNMYVEVNSERVQRQWKAFDERATPEAIREWTNAQFEPSNTFAPKPKQPQVPKSIEELEAAWEAGDPKKLKPKYSTNLTKEEKLVLNKALDRRLAQAKAQGDTKAIASIGEARKLINGPQPPSIAQQVKDHAVKVVADNKAMHEQMQVKNKPSGMKHEPVLADPGGKLTPDERAWMEKHPFVQDLMRFHSDLIHHIMEVTGSIWAEGISHVGLSLDPGSHGMSIYNPLTGKHTILFNSFEEIFNTPDPRQAARESVTTAKHEAAHAGEGGNAGDVAFTITDQLDPRFKDFYNDLVNQVKEGGEAGGAISGHGMDWVYRLGEIYGKYGIERTAEAAKRLESIFTKGGRSGGYNPEISNLLRLYQESRRRAETTPDVFAGKGIQQKSPKAWKGFVSGNSGNAGKGTTSKPVTPPSKPVPPRAVVGKAGLLNNRKFSRKNPIFGKIFESLIANRNAELAAGIPPKFSTSFVNAEAQLRQAGYLYSGKPNAQGVLPAGVPAGYERITGGLGKFSGKYAHPEIRKVLEDYLSPTKTGLFNSAVEAVGKAKSLAMSSGLIPNKPLFTAHGFSIASPFSGRAVMEGGLKRWGQAVRYGLNPKLAASHLKAERADIIRATREDNYNPNVDTSIGHGITKPFNTTTGKYGTGKFKKWTNWLAEKQHKHWEGPLFEQMLPALKWQGWKSKLADFQKKGMSRAEAGKAASRVVNDHYSGYNTDTLMETKDFKTVASLTFLAPDWLRSAKNMGINVPKSLITELRGKGTPESRAYLKAGGRMLAAYTAANLLQKSLTGEYMVENDTKDKFTLFLNKEKTSYLNPFGSSIDFFKYPFLMAAAASTDGEKFSKGAGEILSEAAQNRLSPLGRLGTEFITGEDYKGEANLARTTDRFGNYIPATTRGANTFSQLINFGPPQVAQPWNVATGRATPLEGILKVGEMPFGFRKPKPRPGNRLIFPGNNLVPRGNRLIYDQQP